MESPKRPETLTFSELALLYFKDTDKRNAARKLSYWFKVNPVLIENSMKLVTVYVSGFSRLSRFPSFLNTWASHLSTRNSLPISPAYVSSNVLMQHHIFLTGAFIGFDTCAGLTYGNNLPIETGTLLTTKEL